MALFHTTVLDNQIKALPTVDTASGSIATFDTDMTENLVEVECQILAKQEGSGIPSPSNPRPITTYTEMNVGLNGKNVMSVNNYTIMQYEQIALNIILAGDYTFSVYATSTDTDSRNCAIIFLLSDGSTVAKAIARNSRISIQVTFSKPCVAVRLYASNSFSSGEGDTATFSDMMLELGDTATTYEPFNGTTANIPFGQTVANGVLDITTGKLRVTHEIKQITGGMVKHPLIAGGFYKNNVFTNATSSEALSNLFPYSSNGLGNLPIEHFGIDTSYTRLIVNTDYFTDETAFNTYIANTPFVVVYPLATPIEIQLDSITLQALLNENNIWCDTGDISEVKYLLTVGEALRQA